MYGRYGKTHDIPAHIGVRVRLFIRLLPLETEIKELTDTILFVYIHSPMVYTVLHSVRVLFLFTFTQFMLTSNICSVCKTFRSHRMPGFD